MSPPHSYTVDVGISLTAVFLFNPKTNLHTVDNDHYLQLI